jgi:hypothetical protein
MQIKQIIRYAEVHPYPPSGDSLSSSMDRALRTRAVKRIVGHQGKRKLGPRPPILQIMILKLSKVGALYRYKKANNPKN